MTVMIGGQVLPPLLPLPLLLLLLLLELPSIEKSMAVARLSPDEL